LCTPKDRINDEEGETMNKEIAIVDRGRGLQLSTSRVTVQDLVPYFQDGCSFDEILCLIPTLTIDEIAVVEEYYRTHKQELDEEDRLIREQTTHRKNPPEIDEILRKGGEKMATLRDEFQRRKQERNGDQPSR
jgi:uncharacterized protein (DUF433 family)